MEKTSVLTLIEVKKINQKRVYEFLYRQKTASKLEIANAINVSLPTVASSLNTLIAQGLVSNCGVYDSTGGRKAQIFCCNALARIAVGVELLKERVEIVAVDLYGNTLAEDFLELEFENEASYYSKLGEWINQFVKALPYTGEQNLGVCISLQGLISDDGETITYSEILKCTGVTRSTYQEYIDYPVTLVHDTEAAAQAEVWYRDDITDDAVYIALNRNLGGTLILGNRNDTFKRNGLIEHITLDPDGPLCYCGKQGCLDASLAMAVWALGNATGAEGGDTDLKAIQFVAEWLVGNRIHFDDYCENDRLERWGAIEDKTCATGYLWYVFSSVLDRALAGANYDRAKTLRRMEEEGLLVCDSGHRYTKQKRFRNAGRVYCVCIDNEALEAFLERAATGAGAAVIASQGGAPC